MPPAISDDEISDAGVEVPIRSAQKGPRDKKSVNYSEPKLDEFDDDDDADSDGVVEIKKPVSKSKTVEEEEEEDDEDGEEEYIVEKIISHVINDEGQPLFEVKWEGYEKKADRTWEPEDNLQENASEALDEYFESIGGREKLFEDTKKALTTKKRGRQSTGTASSTKRARTNATHPADSTPPASSRAAAPWKPPPGNWDDEIANLDACEDEEQKQLVVYLTWKNGHKTQHPLPVIYKRAPQKMLQFYERHVRIIKKDPTTPRDEDD